MHWRCDDTEFELIARAGQALVFGADGDPLTHDYDIDEMERLLLDGGYQLEEVGPTPGPQVGRFRGFSDRKLYLGLREIEVVQAPPSRQRRLFFFGS